MKRVKSWTLLNLLTDYIEQQGIYFVTEDGDYRDRLNRVVGAARMVRDVAIMCHKPGIAIDLRDEAPAPTKNVATDDFDAEIKRDKWEPFLCGGEYAEEDDESNV